MKPWLLVARKFRGFHFKDLNIMLRPCPNKRSCKDHFLMLACCKISMLLRTLFLCCTASIHMDIIANKSLSLISILSLQAHISDKHVRLARENRPIEFEERNQTKI